MRIMFEGKNVESLIGQMEACLEVMKSGQPAKVPEKKFYPRKKGKTDKDLAIEALNKVHSIRGTMAAREIMKEFGIEIMSQLPEEKYPDFIDSCIKALE